MIRLGNRIELMKKHMRLIGCYSTGIVTWNHDFFLDLKQKHETNKRRTEDGLPAFPKPEEIFNAPYLFVLSTGRCGTGLVTKILAESPYLLVYHNPKPELEYVSSLIHRTTPSAEALNLAILAARFDSFVNSFQRGKIYVETNNRITLFAPALASLLPNAKFVHLVRNPADFVRSGMRRHYYDEGYIQHQRLNQIDQHWQDMMQLEKIAWEWNEINDAIENFKETLSSNRIITLRSEDLYTKTKATSLIFDFLYISNPFQKKIGSRRLEYLLRHPVNMQKSGSFPKYPNWSNGDKSALARIATLAPRYGYNF